MNASTFAFALAATVAVAAVAAVAVPATAAPSPEPEAAPPPPSLGERIDEAVAPYVEAGDFAGVVAVGRDGEPPVVRAYGPASRELDAPHRPDGIFMIGSISKQLTAATVLLLAEDGLLSLDDRVSEHLPGFAHREVTLEQLLTHTSGVADVYSLERFGATAGQGGTQEEVVADLSATPLTHPPGTAYAYSNGGYSVLAAVLERVSGLSFGELLERRIFAPLGMSRSAAAAVGPAVPGRVPGYDPWGVDDATPVAPVAPAYLAGSGSVWSSAADLLAWTAALHGRRVLAPASYAALVRDHGQGYGYGVSVFERFGRRVVGHDGRVAGYASDLARYVDDRLTVAVLGNVQSVARDEIRRLVAAAALGEEVEVPERRPLAPRPPPPELAGVYAFGPAFTVTVTIEDGRLLARANQGGSSELVATEDGEWFSRMLYARVCFGRDEAGAVDRLIWGCTAGSPAGRRAS